MRNPLGSGGRFDKESFHALFDKYRTNRLAKGAFWSIAGAVVWRGLQLLAFVIVARILDEEKYGELGIIQQTIVLFGNFAGFGLGLAATKYLSEYKKTDPDKASRIVSLVNIGGIVTSGIAACVLFFCSNYFATTVYSAPHLAYGIEISAVALIFTVIYGIQLGTLAGFEEFKTISKINLVTGVTTLVFMVYGSYTGGVNGAVWAIVAGQFVNMVLSISKVLQSYKKWSIKIRIRDISSEKKIFTKFCVPSLFRSSVVIIINWLIATMLVNTENGYAENGIYNALNQWFYLLLFVPQFVGRALIPILSENVGLGAYDVVHHYLEKMTKLIIVVCIAIVVGVTPFSKLIMSAYGAGFSGAWPALIVTVVSGALIAIQTPIANFINAAALMWTGFFMNVIWAVFYLGSGIFLLKYGAMGVVTARLIGYVVNTVAMFVFAYYYRPLRQARFEKRKKPFSG